MMKNKALGPTKERALFKHAITLSEGQQVLESGMQEGAEKYAAVDFDAAGKRTGPTTSEGNRVAIVCTTMNYDKNSDQALKVVDYTDGHTAMSSCSVLLRDLSH